MVDLASPLASLFIWLAAGPARRLDAYRRAAIVAIVAAATSAWLPAPFGFMSACLSALAWTRASVVARAARRSASGEWRAPSKGWRVIDALLVAMAVGAIFVATEALLSSIAHATGRGVDPPFGATYLPKPRPPPSRHVRSRR
jgi:hypothetical protein